MYPDTQQPPSTTPPPPDYINQIAPAAPKRLSLVFGPKLVLFVGGILVVIAIIVAITVNVLVQNGRRPLEHLAARLNSTTAVIETAKSSLKSSQLRSLNSSLSLYFSNINRDIVDPLKSAGVTLEKIDDKVTKEESVTAITARLEDARLNGIYDRTYAREMSYRLETLITLMKQIETTTGNTRVQTFVKGAYPNLTPTQKALADFNAANG